MKYYGKHIGTVLLACNPQKSVWFTVYDTDCYLYLRPVQE